MAKIVDPVKIDKAICTESMIVRMLANNEWWQFIYEVGAREFSATFHAESEEFGVELWVYSDTISCSYIIDTWDEFTARCKHYLEWMYSINKGDYEGYDNG